MKKRTVRSYFSNQDTEYIDGWVGIVGSNDYMCEYHEWQCPKCKQWNQRKTRSNKHWCVHCHSEITDSDCFITSATLLKLKKTDNCYELNKFREFRDNWLKSYDPDEILEYYKIAPSIVDKIDEQKNSENIYSNIWDNHLSQCLSLIENNQFDRAFTIYKSMFNNLKKQFLDNSN